MSTRVLQALYAGDQESARTLAETDPLSLAEAAALGDLVRVQAELESGQAVDTPSPDGWPPLHLAAFFGHHAVVERLLASGAAINQFATSVQGNTALHAALAGATGDPAFDPEPVTADDIARWVSRAAEEARDTLTLLSGDSIPGEAAPAAAGLVAAGSRLLEWIADAASVPPTGLRTRIHGSFQLDQVLVVENDFVIMDLEGDQDGAPEQAWAKHSPLRDVARLLHSLNHARNRAVARASQHEGDDERLAPGATLWLEEMREAFLAGYADEAQVQGTIPDHDTFQSQLPLVQLFEAQRALVEIRSHLATRPDIAAAAAHWLVAVVGAPQPPDEPPEQ